MTDLSSASPPPQPPDTGAAVDSGLLTGREVAAQAGVSLASARKLWRALGYPRVDGNVAAFSPEDAAALNQVVALVRAGVVDEATIITWARALGQTTERLVSWQVESLCEFLATRMPQEQVPQAARALLDGIAPQVEQFVAYGWKRKLKDALDRLDENEADQVNYLTETVGFADLSSYSRLSQKLGRRDLVVLIQRFEGLAADLITNGGGRLIKSIGDEVLFSAPDPEAGAVIGLALAEYIAEDPVLPKVRIGMAHGKVVLNLGDVYGPTVNLASRLTGLARPGTVLTDAHTAAELSRADGLNVVAQGQRRARGVGSIETFTVVRSRPGSGGHISLDDSDDDLPGASANLMTPPAH